MENTDRLKRVKELARKLVKEIELLEAELEPTDSPNEEEINSDVVDGLKGIVNGFGS